MSPSWERILRESLSGGPSALTRLLNNELENVLDVPAELRRFAQLNRAVIDQIDADKRWISEQRNAIKLECDRVYALTETMRRAGLYSYQKDGMVLVVRDEAVSSPETSDEPKP